MAEEPEVLTTTEARGGVGTNVVRYVLIASLVLAVVAMVWTYTAAPTATQQAATTAPVPATPPAS